MKAVQLTKLDGGKGVFINDVDKPRLDDDRMLVEVHEAGVNPFDWKIRDAGGMGAPLPATLGGDFAGVVSDMGKNVAGFKPGDQVYGMAGFFNGGTGSFAEYDLIDPKTAALKPASINETEAGALPLAGVMAVQALTEIFKLAEGQKLLIQGGAGGIGSIAIQIATHQCAYVAVTCGKEEIGYVTELGADEAIDFRTQRFEDMIHDYDAVYDLVGGDVFRRSFKVIRPGGMIVSSLENPDEGLMQKHQVKAIYQHFDITTDRLNKLAQLVDEGVVKVHVEKTFPLDATGEAMTFLETVHPKGKVVINVK